MQKYETFHAVKREMECRLNGWKMQFYIIKNIKDLLGQVL